MNFIGTVDTPQKILQAQFFGKRQSIINVHEVQLSLVRPKAINDVIRGPGNHD